MPTYELNLTWTNKQQALSVKPIGLAISYYCLKMCIEH